MAKILGYDVSKLEDIDGVNQWQTISEDLPTVREHLIVDLDDERNMRAVVTRSFKYVRGPIPPSASPEYSSFLNLDTIISEESPNPNVTGSPTWSILQKHTKDSSLAQRIPVMRKQATQTCEHDLDNTVDCSSQACLFNLDKDPCEQTNVASMYPHVRHKLQQVLAFYKAFEVPDVPLIVDPDCNPDNFNGTWSIWSE